MDVGARRYFAYGSNMDVTQMSQRCSGAVLRGVGKLPGYRFVINTGGVATVVPESSGTVHGVLWDLTEADEQKLDRYEGVNFGHYRKIIRTVEVAQDHLVPALVYVAADDRPGSPRAGYLERIVAAAEVHRLPSEYVRELRMWSETGD